MGWHVALPVDRAVLDFFVTSDVVDWR